MGGRKGRNGVFPATACIKLTGVYGSVLALIFNIANRDVTSSFLKIVINMKIERIINV